MQVHDRVGKLREAAANALKELSQLVQGAHDPRDIGH